MIAIGAVNYVAVLVAAVVSFIIGWVWYSPMLFGNKWMKLNGMSNKDKPKMKEMMMQSVVLGFITTFISAFVLAHFVSGLGLYTALTVGFLLWFGFMMPLAAGPVLWEGKPSALFFINGAHYLVCALVMSAILAMM